MLREHRPQVQVDLRMVGIRPVSGFCAQIQHRITGRIGVAAHEIAVVLTLAPTETRDGVRRLIGIPHLPTSAGKEMTLYTHRYTAAGVQLMNPVGEPMELQLPLANGRVDAQAISIQGLERIGREVEIAPTHGVLPQHAVEIIHFRPYVPVVVLELQDVLPLCRQVDGHAPHPFERAVFETVTHRCLQRHDLRQFLVRAERQTDMHAFVLVDLQNLLDMTDIDRRTRRNITRRSDRCEELRRADDRQTVQRREGRVARSRRRWFSVSRYIGIPVFRCRGFRIPEPRR